MYGVFWKPTQILVASMSCSFPRCNLQHLGGLWPGAGTVKTWRHQRCSSRAENRQDNLERFTMLCLAAMEVWLILTASRFCFPIKLLRCCATHRKSEIIGDHRRSWIFAGAPDPGHQWWGRMQLWLRFQCQHRECFKSWPLSLGKMGERLHAKKKLSLLKRRWGASSFARRRCAKVF